uniref:Uncharacterized protein n=1 Tax=Panagrolaimus sp. ES5 TaxID=591445 RepID=A0AC34F227_9BILA
MLKKNKFIMSDYSDNKNYQQQLINKQNDGMVTHEFCEGVKSIKDGIKESAREFKNGVREVVEAVGEKLSPKS